MNPRNRHLGLTLCLLVFVVSCSNKVTIESSSRPTKSSHHTQSKHVCRHASNYVDTVVGDGHCVSLIKHCSGAPNTSQWRPGRLVMSGPTLEPGTIIATFKNQRYPNEHGYHAAIYISHSKAGIWVWDQWIGKPVHKRLIRARNDAAPASNKAQAYRVVEFAP